MVNNYKIEHDRESCIGCGACASVCPKFWEMNSDGKSDVIGAVNSDDMFAGGEVLDNLNSDFDSNNEAAESCPVNCIHLFDKDNDEKII